ncbi:hypothetical protein DCS_01104 [Drechmeria coniospora]|uniref:Uncharacterized protein n=1 Tax=Drechmeria coniospora TaxID=98403 RepID=A0A151GSB2_DRECN|nr:hypothetical protein DCS_01104 [Drechmeria coniospora]KYK59970.1 hypothetical protein DCS_01104 [Drechmeria coniospora]
MNGPRSRARDGSHQHQQLHAKDVARPSTPPPAYSPSRFVDVRTVMARQLAHSRQAQPHALVVDSTPCVTAVSDYGSDGESAPIHFQIKTAVKVASNNNLVCLGGTPADCANAVAASLAKAMRDYSAGHCGMPMIDEDGRPRPIRLVVDAGITVEGSGNILGDEKVVMEVLRQRGKTLRRGRDDLDDQGEAVAAAGPSKRKRSGGE